MISLDHDMTYTTLVEHLEKELKVSKSGMKLRHGFPPRELGPHKDGEEELPLPLQHGDRLTVEIAPEPEPGWYSITKRCLRLQSQKIFDDLYKRTYKDHPVLALFCGWLF